MDSFNQPIQGQRPAPSQPQFDTPAPTSANEPVASIDYLNQIAPQAPKKIRLNLIQIILIAVGALAIIITLSIVISSLANAGKNDLQHLAARLQSTETIVGDAQSKIKSTNLRALNSNLKIYLTNTNRDIAAPLLKQNITVSKLDKTIVASESGTDITNRLEDARLNAIYDRTYAREIAYRLATIIALMDQINSSTSSTSLKTFLGDSIKNLEPTQASFEDFNATNG
jgi:hypothetical protein